MSEPTPRLDLRELALRGGQRFEHAYHLELGPVFIGGIDYRVLVPGGATVRVERVAGGFLITTSLEARVYGPCMRCLREVTLDVSAEEQEFVPTAPEDWEEGDVTPFARDMVVDVAGLARESVILELPLAVLCDEECAGLCPTCGKDLNAGPCSCPPAGVDARWRTLKDLGLDEPGSGRQGDMEPGGQS